MDDDGAVHLDDVPVSDTPVARLATEVATEYQSPALLNHCIRSYLWAASLGVAAGLVFDTELLHVASMLHDMGLIDPFDSHTLDFEQAGGHLGWVFAAGAGWPVARRRWVAEVIVRHMWTRVDPDSDPEGYLLEAGTALDIAGRDADRWPREVKTEVLALHPRLGLDEEFSRCLQDQADRKPFSAAARIMEGRARRADGSPPA